MIGFRESPFGQLGELSQVDSQTDTIMPENTKIYIQSCQQPIYDLRGVWGLSLTTVLVSGTMARSGIVLIYIGSLTTSLIIRCIM